MKVGFEWVWGVFIWIKSSSNAPSVRQFTGRVSKVVDNCHRRAFVTCVELHVVDGILVTAIAIVEAQ